jgi:hypothetical protein
MIQPVEKVGVEAASNNKSGSKRPETGVFGT